jgi:cell division protein FtsN
MRKTAVIGIAIYVAVVGGVIGGAYAAFETLIGPVPADSASLVVAKLGPGAPTSRKWTPVEIKRDVAERPPVPAYVAPSSTARARVAKNGHKRVVVVAQRAAPRIEQRTQQRLASYAPVRSAYAPVEQPRSFGPFSFRF